MKTEEKINVFISSKCGGERLSFNKLVEENSNDKKILAERANRTNYDLVRRALKVALENTGFIKTYVFEDAAASTAPVRDDYLYKLDRSDICLFLIDNFEREIPQGVLLEYERARQNNKKSIFIFLKHPDYEKTFLEKKLQQEGERYHEVNDIRNFIDQGYKSVIEDIITTYQKYCRGYFDYDAKIISSIDITEESFPSETAYVDKQIFKNLGKTKNKILSLVHPPFKEDVPTSELDELNVSMLEVLLGEKKFLDFDTELLTDALGNIQNPKLHKIVIQRWEIIGHIYNGDLDTALATIENIYNEHSDDPTVPEWILADILIDWRNLKGISDQSKNIYSWSVQEKINQQDSTIYFPVIDRFSTNINDDIWGRNFKILTGSNILYNFENLFGYISNYLLTAIYYGSYTHITLTLKEIQKALFDLVQKENNLADKTQLIRISILQGNESNFSKIMDKYGSALSRSTSKEIFELYRLAETKPLNYQKLVWKVILFRELGYYLSNDDYEPISNEIFSLSHNWIDKENTSISLIERSLKALTLNIRRLSQEDIIVFLIKILDKKYYRFFDTVFEILKNVDYSKLSVEIAKHLLSRIRVTLDEKEKKRDYLHVDQALIKFRKYRDDFSEEIDEIVKKHYPVTYENDYNLEVSKEKRDTHIQRFIDSIKVRNKTQGKNGLYTGYADRPFLTIKNIIERDKVSISTELLDKLLETILETLCLETQTYSTKIDAVQLLITLKKQKLNYKYRWSKFYSDFQNNFEEMEKAKSGFFMQEKSLSLRLNLIIVRCMFSKDCLQELLETLAVISNSDENEIISSLVALKDFLEIETNDASESSILPISVQYISSFCFHKSHDVRFHTVRALYSLIKSQYTDFVIERLSKMMDDDDYKVRWAVLDQVLLIKKQNEQTYNYMIQRAKIDNHHLVRRMI